MQSEDYTIITCSAVEYCADEFVCCPFLILLKSLVGVTFNDCLWVRSGAAEDEIAWGFGQKGGNTRAVDADSRWLEGGCRSLDQ